MSTFFPGSNDVFRTQADTRFNSFSEPLNSVNMNPGPWGVDPNYLTPPYLSPFRPQYQGPSGPSYARFKPSWATSFNQVVNPFAPGGENYGGNYSQQQSPYYDALVQKPMDRTASFAQNWVVPGAASWAAFRYLGEPSKRLGATMGSRLMGGLFSGMGVKAAAAGAEGATAGQMAASMGIRAGGVLGGFAGELVLPTLAAQAAVHAVDKAVFDPYIGQRRTANDLRENFRGVTFGEGGDLFTGGGLSRKTAASIARGVSKAGSNDMTFTQNETSLLTDYASRAGLLDNASPNQMAQRFETVLKQVKLVMAVANTSDFKETIEIMSKMQMAGAGSSQLAGLMGGMSSAAAISGQSVQKLMNTVGAQGQYLFAAQGLTPYVGQQAAFNSNASMAAAYRSGLLSPSMMARMGGVEGATQSATAAQIAAYQTPYASMQAYNAYMGAGETGNVVSNMARFGGSMSTNMLQNVGRMQMMQGALTSRHIQDRGVFGEQEQIYQLAKQLPNGIGANGKVDPGVAYMIMTQMMGLTPEMAQSKMSQFASFGDKKSVDIMLAGNQRASIELLQKYQQQEGLNKGIFTTPINAVKRGAMAVQREAGDQIGGMIENVNAAGDRVENWANEAFFGVKPGENRFQTLAKVGDREVMQVNTDNFQDKIFGGDNPFSSKKTNPLRFKKDLDKINELAKNRDSSAMVLLDPKSSKLEKRNAIYDLKRKGLIKGDFDDTDEMDAMVKTIGDLGTTKLSKEEGGGTTIDAVKSGLEKVLKGGNIDNSIEYMNLMSKVSDTLSEGGEIDEATRKRIAELSHKDLGDLDNRTLEKMSGETMTIVGEQRLTPELGLGKVGDAKGLEKAINDERGGIALGPVVKSSGDVKALNQQIKAQAGIAQARGKIQQMAREGKIDMNTAMGAINSLDNGAAVGKFSNAVDLFAQTIGAMNGGKKEDTPTMYEYFVQGKRAGGRDTHGTVK